MLDSYLSSLIGIVVGKSTDFILVLFVFAYFNTKKFNIQCQGEYPLRVANIEKIENRFPTFQHCTSIPLI